MSSVKHGTKYAPASKYRGSNGFPNTPFMPLKWNKFDFSRQKVNQIRPRKVKKGQNWLFTQTIYALLLICNPVDRIIIR